MWFDLLKKAVAESNITQVAAKLDVSRTTISLVLDSKYQAKTDKVAARVMEVYSRLDCPHMKTSIGQKECSQYRNRSVPTSSPRAMQHWRACQSCEIGIRLSKGEISCCNS